MEMTVPVSWMITGSGALEREPQFVFADPLRVGL